MKTYTLWIGGDLKTVVIPPKPDPKPVATLPELYASYPALFAVTNPRSLVSAGL